MYFGVDLIGAGLSDTMHGNTMCDERRANCTLYGMGRNKEGYKTILKKLDLAFDLLGTEEELDQRSRHTPARPVQRKG